jgi:hypothetical protein
VLVISAEALDDSRILVAVVGTKRRRPEVASRAEFWQHARGTLVVGSLEYGDEIVGANGPVDLRDAYSCFWASDSAWSRRWTVSFAVLTPWSVQFIEVM